jgi:tRNA threonylcarbamoyladenosine biosynthesis protein TsaB
MRLAIETSSDRASVALGRTSVDAIEQEVVGARRHAGALLPMVEELLRKAAASLNDVSALVLSDGPGSFTGLRVGASVAKALAHARGLPLWTAPSLLVRAGGVARPGATVVAVSNALRGDVYAAAYRFEVAGVRTLLAPTVARPEMLVHSSLAPDLLVGEAPEPAVRVLESWARTTIVRPPDGAPRARVLLGLVDVSGGARQIEAVEGWEPDYGRPAEAQARWETAHGRPLSDSLGRSG